MMWQPMPSTLERSKLRYEVIWYCVHEDLKYIDIVKYPHRYGSLCWWLGMSMYVHSTKKSSCFVDPMCLCCIARSGGAEDQADGSGDAPAEATATETTRWDDVCEAVIHTGNLLSNLFCPNSISSFKLVLWQSNYYCNTNFISKIWF